MRKSDIVVGGVYTNGKAERQVLGIRDDTLQYLIVFKYDIAYRNTTATRFAQWAKEREK